ncbi:Sjogren's syndrome/scleroderma autoantigen 1 family protein [Natrinema sp. 1APR25-10V2]|uniref:Sjogren's syndrome/scleroderma autoantigen 1 family protein n=1 Tax=Natrinema sp. 1APR25-10V2 TaxID=2951081 RepID=UPI0028771393|nr:Sjogren's syndrome/scleroderma autoantigen 1 family protein [Natrinema sp. 1APR25-10V2]MDS0476122.1 hypothetical protein [Natrinema sp. 1APR25-10V2]
MSDFDKEAEREKLREKYERDKKEREATQRMSDLLLKGATMTNAHCGTCGDPLFQENGTTFCPSCHGNPDAVDGTELEAQPAEDQPATDQSTADRPAPDTAETEADAAADAGAEPTTVRHRRGDDVARDTQPETAASSADSEPQSSTAPPRDRQSTAGSDAESAPATASDGRSADAAPSRHAPAASPSSVDGDLEAARADLVRALEKFAAEAAATDDPRYARDCLEAAREASETLSTLR